MSKACPERSRGIQCPRSLYIHIPFCVKKCNYCDFVSYPGKEALFDKYVDALVREIKSSPPFIPLSIGDGEGETRREGVRTVYFGGGTPTLLDPEHFEKIIVRAIEVSIESNPGTANLSKLKALRELGINRLSIGVQSFNDKHLKNLGRIHNAKDIYRFYEDARSAGFENINLDLMFALPGQTLNEWKKDLAEALRLQPEHLSVYNLQIEEATPFASVVPLPLPSNEEELAMYEYAIETLTDNGYKHYEISNFARPGYECAHNINYWKNGNYIGIGVGAHSHINGSRWSNPNCVEEYLKTPSSFLPLNKGENVERSETRGGDTLFLGLRLLEGLPIGEFAGFEAEVKGLMDDGLLQSENGNYKLTRQGLYLANEVFEKFV